MKFKHSSITNNIEKSYVNVNFQQNVYLKVKVSHIECFNKLSFGAPFGKIKEIFIYSVK